MIAREIRSRDLQISQQLKEIERYRQERKQNLCGFCQKKMDNVSSCGGGGQLKLKQMAEDRVTQLQSVEVQTEEWRGFGKGCAVRKEVATNAEEAAADDDWYANGNSDNENEKSPVSLYERGVNPVLERVNQVRKRDFNCFRLLFGIRRGVGLLMWNSCASSSSTIHHLRSVF